MIIMDNRKTVKGILGKQHRLIGQMSWKNRIINMKMNRNQNNQLTIRMMDNQLMIRIMDNKLLIKIMDNQLLIRIKYNKHKNKIYK